MFKKIGDFIIETIKEEWKFIIFMCLLIIVLNFPLNYYIVMGGGMSDAAKRIDVDGKQKSEGSFNISYVTQLDANILFYGLSYIIPTWDRESADNYKYSTEENIEDIEFRGDLDLKVANSNATYWAYTLAGKEVKEISSTFYVIATYSDKYETPLKVGDEILSLDGNTYEVVDDYVDYLQTKEVGDIVKIKINRKGKEMELESTVHEDGDKTKVIGIYLQNYKEYETDPKLDIHFYRNESGPSGGSIVTLEIYNQLTKKDITKGYTIAGTGTIEPNGTIGQIGGIEYKILGAVAGHADYFISPGGKNYEQAKKYIEEKKLKIKLIKAETIEEAIQKLEELE